MNHGHDYLSDEDKEKCKFVVVTGGTLSGLGKGTTISSLGVCLKTLGVHVTSVKIDPYLNIDAGTMSPFEHGECFVLEDGSETDLDLGNYERMLSTNLTRNSCITTGKLYSEVMEKERRGDYLGKTVQIVPHVTDHLVTMLLRAASTAVDGNVPDVTLIEVGGTVGDIESVVFLEALSRLRCKLGKGYMTVIHLGYVPILYGEQKTKPTQATVRQLRASGLEPNWIMVRCHEKLEEKSRAKIALHCNLDLSRVVSVHDVSNKLMVADTLYESKIAQKLIMELNLPTKEPPFTITDWRKLAHHYDSAKVHKLKVAIVAKYSGQGVCGQNDTYLSVIEAIKTAGVANDCNLTFSFVNADDIESVESINNCDCVIVPGGFGSRGIEGKIRAIEICRKNQIPILGICLGFQLMAIECARNVLGITDAHSEEMDPDTNNKVVIYMPETRNQENIGGTMVLGARTTKLKEDTLAYDVYRNQSEITERHRHRYELNIEYVKKMEQIQETNYIFSGWDEYNERVHILEINREQHPFFFGVQFHPEFNSKLLKPSLIFDRLIRSAVEHTKK